MGVAREIPPPVTRRADEGRKFGRIRLSMVGSNLGEVADVSSLGARIRCQGFRGPTVNQIVTLRINGVDGMIELQARVVWARRTGLFQHEAGVEFRDPSPEAMQGLIAVVRTAPMNDILARIEQQSRSA
jgi:hypothetical protein